MITNVAIEISDKCNLNCLHCYYSEKNCNSEMSYDNFILILDRFKHLDKVVITGGEPFTNSRFTDILKECIKRNNIQFTITTNGTLFTPQIIKYFRESSNIHFQISMEGSNSDLNDVIRGKGTYEKVIASLRELAAIDCNRIKLRMTVNGLNYSDCETFYHFSKNLHIVPEYMFVSKIGNAIKNWDRLQISDQQKLFVYSKIARLYRLDQLDMAAPTEVQECSLCDSYTVTTEGNIYVCSYFPDCLIGNILQQDEESIEDNYCNHEIFTRISKWKNDVYQKLCVNCTIKDKCGQGCYGRYICNNGKNPSRLDDGCCNFRKLRFIYNHLDHM